jgi:hypothetical protein
MKTLLAMLTLALVLGACGDDEGLDLGDAGGRASGARDVTWHADIAPLLTTKCVGCHRDGGLAPFSLERYDDAAPLAALLLGAVEAGIMPPFLAQETDECVPRHGWKDDLRLDAAQKALLRAWVAAEAPEGDPATARAAKAAELELDDPDLTLTIPSEIEISPGGDKFMCFVLDTGLDVETWVDSMQIRAGNPGIVHHVLVYDDVNLRLSEERLAAGQYECFGGTGVSGATLVQAWAPGAVPLRTPADSAIRLQAGARLIMQVHYHPTREPQIDDATSVDFRFAAGRPIYQARSQLIGNFTSPVIIGGLLPGPNDPPGVIEFRIPAGARGHTETAEYLIAPNAADMVIYGMGTHMHYAGTDMAVHLEHAAPAEGEPARECLIQTPRWDFSWQRGYQYDAPIDELPVARPGDRLLFRCTYDNSMDNPFVHAALIEQDLPEPKDILMGEETLDEMCLGGFAVISPVDEE